MKHLKSKFEKIANIDKIYGGNNSDVTYTDSKNDGGGWDIAVISLIDTIDSSRGMDKPQSISLS